MGYDDRGAYDYWDDEENEQAWRDEQDDIARLDYEWAMYMLRYEAFEYTDDTDLPWDNYLPSDIPF